MLSSVLAKPSGLAPPLLLCLSRPLSTSGVLLSERPNIQHPRHPCRERSKLLTLSRPVYPRPHATTQNLWQECPKLEEERVLAQRETANALELLYAQELKDWMRRSKLVGLFHANNIKYYPRHFAWQNARRFGMELKSYNVRIGRAGLQGTRWENLLHFWHTGIGDQYLVFGQDDQVKDLLKLDKKMPDFALMGALVDNRILNKQQLQDYAAMPLLDAQRGQLCSILQMPAQKMSSLLASNQQDLSRNLEQYLKDRQEPTAPSAGNDDEGGDSA